MSQQQQRDVDGNDGERCHQHSPNHFPFYQLSNDDDDDEDVTKFNDVDDGVSTIF